jgi:carotenoid cleavage dioxygenase-like enzyme
MNSAQTTSTWRGIFRDLPREHGFEPLRVEGRVPDEIRGALYRIGPARFSVAGDRYPHWFDGDGAVTAVRFANGEAHGAVKFVDTHWMRAESAAKKRLYRGYSQTGRGVRRWMFPKNPANTALLPWNGQLLALWEAGLPIALDPATLETRGETNLDGKIRPTFSAHPHRAGSTTYNFGIRPGPHFALDLYAFKNDVKRIASLPLPFPTTIHDFITTPRHLVFFCPPVRLRLARFLAGFGTYEQNLAWEPARGTEVIVVPLATPDAPIRFTVDPFYQWHFVNAWEESGERIAVDFLPYDDFASNDWWGRFAFEPQLAPPRSRYARATIDLAAKRIDVETLADTQCEFPAIHPHDAGTMQPHTWFLSFDDTPPRLCRFDLATRDLRVVPLGDNAVPSEAVVLPQGFVLTLVYDPARDSSYVAVIDATRPEDGAVARLWFDHFIPFPFHGAWEVQS